MDNIACSECGLTMDQTKLLFGIQNGEVVVVPMDLFKEMRNAISIEHTQLLSAVNAVLPPLFEKKHEQAS